MRGDVRLLVSHIPKFVSDLHPSNPGVAIADPNMAPAAVKKAVDLKNAFKVYLRPFLLLLNWAAGFTRRGCSKRVFRLEYSSPRYWSNSASSSTAEHLRHLSHRNQQSIRHLPQAHQVCKHQSFQRASHHSWLISFGDGFPKDPKGSPTVSAE